MLLDLDTMGSQSCDVKSKSRCEQGVGFVFCSMAFLYLGRMLTENCGEALRNPEQSGRRFKNVAEKLAIAYFGMSGAAAREGLCTHCVCADRLDARFHNYL